MVVTSSGFWVFSVLHSLGQVTRCSVVSPSAYIHIGHSRINSTSLYYDNIHHVINMFKRNFKNNNCLWSFSWSQAPIILVVIPLPYHKAAVASLSVECIIQVLKLSNNCFNIFLLHLRFPKRLWWALLRSRNYVMCDVTKIIYENARSWSLIQILKI